MVRLEESENHFAATLHGKMDWNERRRKHFSLFGWVCRADDYNNKSGPIVTHLRKYGDLKSIDDHEEEGNRKNKKLVEKLVDTIEDQNQNIHALASRCNETTLSR